MHPGPGASRFSPVTVVTDLNVDPSHCTTDNRDRVEDRAARNTTCACFSRIRLSTVRCPNVAVLWVAAVFAGIAGAAIDVGVAAIVSDQTTLATRAAAMAGWNAITGARGIAAAFLMSALVQVGIVTVQVGLLLCAISSIVGVLLFVRTSSGVPVDTRAWEIAPATPVPSSARVIAR